MLAPESFWPRDKKRGRSHAGGKVAVGFNGWIGTMESDAAAKRRYKVKIKSGENKGNFADGHVLMEGLLR